MTTSKRLDTIHSQLKKAVAEATKTYGKSSDVAKYLRSAKAKVEWARSAATQGGDFREDRPGKPPSLHTIVERERAKLRAAGDRYA